MAELPTMKEKLTRWANFPLEKLAVYHTFRDNEPNIESIYEINDFIFILL